MTDEELDQWASRAAARRPEPNSEAEREASIEHTMHEIFADPTRVPASFRDDLRWQAAHAAPGQFAALAGDWPGLAREPYDQLKVPTLVVWGEADTMIAAERGHRLVAALPHARYAGLPGVGHTCHIEAPR